MEPPAFDFDYEQRDEFLMKETSYVVGHTIFEVIHLFTNERLFYVKQNSDYVDNSKIIYDTKSNRKLFKLRRDQGLPVMPMYIHDYRTKTEYKWKGREVYVADKKSPGHKVTITPSEDKSSFDVVQKTSGKTIAWVNSVDKTEKGVCSYKISCASNFDIAFIVTLIVCADDRYMGMAKLSDASYLAVCNIV